ncbi:HupE/UreJ family protein [Marinobacter sp. M3C]|uniref:HupE/UreJ family protein n=1 Tax=Marinobacter sp. M3C TaxID=2917715 RepID=UPI0024B36D78|nr:HupE/UreJ family protein [Marinobacter sp. M3C]
MSTKSTSLNTCTGTGISLSVILVGILIAILARLPTVVGGSRIAPFMVFYGFAHEALMQKTDKRAGRILGGVIASISALLAAT